MPKKQEPLPEWAVRAKQISDAKRGRIGQEDPREGFWLLLILAAVAACCAGIVFAFQGRFLDQGEVGAWTFAILLTVLVLAALYFLAAFRITWLGEKLLNRTPLREDPQVVDHIGFGFDSDSASASAEKRAASARVRARAARRAAVRNTKKRDPDSE